MFVRRVVVAVTSLIGVFVGLWAAAFPVAFYQAFPGLGFGPWISIDGPYNEHLIRDVGALYLALAGAGVYAAATGSLQAARTVGIAWIVFSVPHLGYHLHHLAGMTASDAIAEVISLSSTVILGAAMLWPDRRTRNGAGQARTRAGEEGR